MMRRWGGALAIGMISCVGVCGASAQGPDHQTAQTKPPVIERGSPATTVPLDVRLGKLFLEAAVDGAAKEFIFDTGSPTILAKDFAQSLDLKIVGRNTGRDANGREVTMDVAVVDALSLGDVTFRDVRVLVFDFSQLELGPCMFDGGVIGSEIFPGSLWEIDTERRVLTISAPGAAPPAAASSRAITLYDFGYPHTPIVDYSVGDVQDKAIFDTGNAEELILFERVAQSDGVRKSMSKKSLQKGRGSDGVSAGGRGAIRDLRRFTLKDASLSAADIGPVRATTRTTAPTLIGAGLLDRFVVTLDYPSNRFVLSEREKPEPTRPFPGYALSFVDGVATVTQLFEGSPAARAGLRLGDAVTAINARATADLDAESVCQATRWLGEALDRTAAVDLVVERAGRTRNVRIPAADE
ncbi:MAG: aspartyl protease family protein [Pseudomonadota bacterium]